FPRAVGRISHGLDGPCPPTCRQPSRAMPNLENLKKQAKQYLRWHRDRHYPVAAQIRALLPRFHDLSDEAILASVFKLSDAREMVARRLGFEGWAGLLRGLPAMQRPDQSTAPQPVLLHAEPQLFVRNIAVSCDFYRDKLGFSVLFTYGEPPFYA